VVDFPGGGKRGRGGVKVEPRAKGKGLVDSPVMRENGGSSPSKKLKGSSPEKKLKGNSPSKKLKEKWGGGKAVEPLVQVGPVI